MLEMSVPCKIAMNAFCRLNGWDMDSIRVVCYEDGLFYLQIRNQITDIDDVRIIPDEYHIGPAYNGQQFGINVYQEDKKLCTLYFAV